MTPTQIILFVSSVAALAVTVRVILHFVDRRRIMRLARSRGWSDVSVRWAPFARGWFGESAERCYRVSYTDALGVRLQRVCKTSMLTGVFWRDDAA